jgi:hypothetical protein
VSTDRGKRYGLSVKTGGKRIMNKIEFINFEGVEIPLAIPVEMDLPKFVSDDEINPNTRRDLLFFKIIQEQLKTLNKK